MKNPETDVCETPFRNFLEFVNWGCCTTGWKPRHDRHCVSSALSKPNIGLGGLKHSYSLKGHPYDNGRMEAFRSILKREEVYLKAYQTLTEVQAAIGWYINFYNRNRISNVA